MSVVVSGEITQFTLYEVGGSSGTITYNGTSYNIGDTFEGGTSKTFTYTETAVVYESTQIQSISIEIPIPLNNRNFQETFQIRSNTIDFVLTNPNYPENITIVSLSIELESFYGNTYIIEEIPNI